ncbi:T-cell antigen CD7-like [Brachyhypopomus gauderio]|uniref:T-cell antigen CD7-like n=1 Tax=Brachyhypopomus gauderio TaxID=698409 RepID=UPI004041A742
MRALRASLCITAALLGACRASAWTDSSVDSDRVIKPEGETLTMECIWKEKPRGLYVYVRRPKKLEVLYYHFSNQKLTENKEYTGRLNISNNVNKITIALTDLQMKDSGLYSCVFNRMDENIQLVEEVGGHVFLFVRESSAERCPVSESAAVPESLVLLLVVTACAVLLLCAVAVVVWMGPKVKALCLSGGENVSRTNNSVYEDMRVHRVQLKD